MSHNNESSNWLKAESEILKHQIEIEWTVLEYPLEDKTGRNIVVRYNTDIDNRSPIGYPDGTKIETDSSGRGWIQRYTGRGRYINNSFAEIVLSLSKLYQRTAIDVNILFIQIIVQIFTTLSKQIP